METFELPLEFRRRTARKQGTAGDFSLHHVIGCFYQREKNRRSVVVKEALELKEKIVEYSEFLKASELTEYQKKLNLVSIHNWHPTETTDVAVKLVLIEYLKAKKRFQELRKSKFYDYIDSFTLTRCITRMNKLFTKYLISEGASYWLGSGVGTIYIELREIKPSVTRNGIRKGRFTDWAATRAKQREMIEKGFTPYNSKTFNWDGVSCKIYRDVHEIPYFMFRISDANYQISSLYEFQPNYVTNVDDHLGETNNLAKRLFHYVNANVENPPPYMIKKKISNNIENDT